MAIQGEGNESQKKEVNKAVNQYLRWAVAGGSSGPGIAETMVLLGRAVTLQRLEDAASQGSVQDDRGVEDAVSIRATTA